MSAIVQRKAVSESVQRVTELYLQRELAEFVLGLTALDLETTQMMLRVLREIEQRWSVEHKRAMTMKELSNALDLLVKNAQTRRQIVQFYESSKSSGERQVLASSKKLIADSPQ
jgi:hypothetical protein